ncbi:hypothetical protein [Undibacter mobilis]|uniref:Uncharacterized protein n=1 Tax=Undibacter mobilis TaxID=2292256 RepID=A0A371BBY4_9BRAD|nr:hypothetical protein [Undibacter mobilis]RDV04861.1 hypothetical protein DXH78_09975 [Undibacter mobilis]
MSRCRALAIAACLATLPVGAPALAQSAWPAPPQAQQPAPAGAWPAAQPQAEAQQAPAGAWPAPNTQSAPASAWPAPQPSQGQAPQAPAQQSFVPPSAGFGAPMGMQQQQQEPPCFKEFAKLSQDTGKKRSAIEQAGKKRVPPAVACRLFNEYTASQGKLLKYVAANTASCGMPKDLLDNLTKSQAQATEIRTRVCEVAAAPPKPAGPTLSDALSAPVPDSGNIKTGRGGTFDTLSGSPLAR